MDTPITSTVEALLLETLQRQRDDFARCVAQHEGDVSICDKALRATDTTQELIQALMPAMTGGGWNAALIEYVHGFTSNNTIMLSVLKVLAARQESEIAHG